MGSNLKSLKWPKQNLELCQLVEVALTIHGRVIDIWLNEGKSALKEKIGHLCNCLVKIRNSIKKNRTPYQNRT